MKSNHTPWNPNRLDVAAFAQAAEVLNGTATLETFHRLQSSCVPAKEAVAQNHTQEGASISWELVGESKAVMGGPPQVWLHLKAQAQVELECQRCLENVVYALNIDRRFLFAKDEATAEEWDETIEEDILVLTASLDVHELVEDELLLALPLIPRHEKCPSHAPALAALASQSDAAELSHPFAVLAQLKKGGA